MILPASQAGQFDPLFEAGLLADIEAKRLTAVSHIQNETVTRGPKLSGWFKGSVFPFVGSPGSFLPEEGLPFYPQLGDEAVDAVVRGATIAETVGVCSNAPHANRLAHGWSEQAADGWTDVVILEASRL